MNRRFWAAVSVAALSTALLVTGPAMSQGQLRQQVSDQLKEHSIQIQNYDSLSDAQVSQIELILNTTGGDAEKRAMVESLLSERKPCVGNDQLRQQVANQLNEHGIQLNLDAVGGNELVVLEAVLNSSESESAKKAAIEGIFTAAAPIEGNEQLRAAVESCVRRLNADVDLTTLTPDQLVQIELIAGGSESESTKRDRIEAIANQ